MNEVRIFENSEFGSVRTVEVNGEPWFVASDIAKALGYTNSRKAISDHVDDEDKGVTKCYTLGGLQDLTVINESGLYSLILSSKLPNAKRFKHWITSEVIPSIRKNGAESKNRSRQAENNICRCRKHKQNFYINRRPCKADLSERSADRSEKAISMA